MVNAFGRTSDLQINVTDGYDILFLGRPEESAGTTLRGTVDLNLSEPMKIKSVVLNFIGKMKVSWTTGSIGHHQQSHKQERTILSYKSNLVLPTLPKKSETLNAGHHHWDFEFTLPGDLPQSLETEMGRVTYRLKAVVDRPAFAHNLVKKQTIRVLRCSFPYGLEHVQSLEIHKTWADKMIYDIALPSKVYAQSETIPIAFNILPIASQLRVVSVMATLKEYCTYTANGHTKIETRIVLINRQENPFREATPTVEASSWSRVLELVVPDRSPLIFCDVENDMIRIHHKLKFVISLVNPDGHFYEVRCTVSIIIIDNFAQQSVADGLPSYNSIWQSVPYDQTVWDALHQSSSTQAPPLSAHPHHVPAENRQPVTVSSYTRSLSISSMTVSVNRDEAGMVFPVKESINDGTETPSTVDSDCSIELWWQGMDLSRVPSYRSTLSSDPVGMILSSLPPAYDAISSALLNGVRS